MPTKPEVPEEIVKELGLREAKPLEETATLIQDTKYTKQFSIKIPRRIISKLHWKAGDKVKLVVESGRLVLKR
ncbi:MAG: AbrB/MazE/SpoVT family DNA-binding domain-containing protein [Candidatus Micrarchaeota archaeon]|nr:AbrB/MazE/SpoVT family DNA-binding domain-containing protein [Candidatus Micrarchaeota archaeon]